MFRLWRHKIHIAAALWIGAVFFAGAGVFVLSHPAAAGDPGLGRSVAQKWCASCHLVAPRGKAIDTAPSFAMMANDPRYTDNRLRRWLFKPHPPMPQIELTKVQTDAIIAYIHSLKRK